MVDESGAGARVQPDHLLAALEALNSRLREGLSERFGRLDLHLRGSEGRILNLIGPAGTRPTALAEGAWTSKQAMGKRLRDLEARSLIRITADPADARALLVHLTEDGRAARDLLTEQIADLEAEVASRVGRHRYEEFRRTLDDLASDRGRDGPAPPGGTPPS